MSDLLIASRDDFAPIRRLSKPPIAEAVLDLRVLPGDGWNPQTLKDEILKELPIYSKKIEEGREIVYTVSLDGTQPKEQRLGCAGYKLTSDDGNHVVQFNKAGFVFNRVREYQDWNLFCDEARTLWTIYCKILNPQVIKRIGVRFINQMVAKETPFS